MNSCLEYNFSTGSGEHSRFTGVSGILMRVLGFVSALAFGSLASFASADWSVVYLDPAVGLGSSASGVSDGQQSGDVDGFAAVWSGNAASWVNLQPDGVIFSYATANAGGQQIGTVLTDSLLYRAGLWTGTAASFVDLTPNSMSEAFGTDTDGIQQVGWGKIGNARAACLWSGTTASFVQLNAPGGGNTWGHGVHNGKQVGAAMIGANQVAAMWSGSSASFVNLGPAGASNSEASAIYGNTQGGSANFTGAWEAVMWNGTAESCIQLSPVASASSNVNAMFENYQVGDVYMNDDFFHASLWNGSAASWFDLSSLLPANYGDAIALGVWGDGANLYITGHAKNTTTNRDEAVMWVQSVPEPASTAIMAVGLLGLAAKRRARKK